MKRNDGWQGKGRDPLNGRREALKKIVTGGGVAVGASLIPGNWIAPVVDKVVVPAHAQTSVTTTTTPCPDDISADYGDSNRWYYIGQATPPYYYQIDLVSTTGGSPLYTYAIKEPRTCTIPIRVDESTGSVTSWGCELETIITVTDANGCTGESIVPLMYT